MPVIQRSVRSISKSGDTKLNGDVTLTGGTNVTLTQLGQDIDISVAGVGNALQIYGIDLDATVGSPSDGDILVYRSAGNDWVLESKPAGGSNPALNDVTDVTITSVADNEVLAYNSGTGEWINQTASEAGLAAASHTHTASNITDFDTEVSNNTDVTANTSSRHDAVTVLDSAEIDFTLTGQQITASLITGSIDETKLDTSVNASLDLADSALQPGDNISTLTNDAGYITATLTNEQVEDIVGAMVSTNTETLITVTYQDIDGTLDFVVDNNLANYDNSTSGFFDASSDVDHDATTNFVANEHIDHTSVTLTAGNGLTGGGDISANRSFAVGAGTGIAVNANDIEVDINGLTTDASPVGSTDYVMTYDASAGNLKKVLLDDLSVGGATTLNSLTDVTITSRTDGDILYFVDSGTGWVNDQPVDIGLVTTSATQTLTNKTISASGNTITNIGASEVIADLITGQNNLTSVDTINDTLLIHDNSASALREITVDDVLNNGWQTCGTLTTRSYTSGIKTGVVYRSSVDETTHFQEGMRIRFVQAATSSNYIYGIITDVSLNGSDTDLTVYFGTDYSMAVGQAITLMEVSRMKTPQGFPLNPNKWRQQYSDSTLQSQASPTVNTWYNIGTASLLIPPGDWYVDYALSSRLRYSGQPSMEWYVTLSSANNSESDTAWTTHFRNVGSNVTNHLYEFPARKKGYKSVTASSGQTFYINSMTPKSGTDDLTFANDEEPIIIRAECAYL